MNDILRILAIIGCLAVCPEYATSSGSPGSTRRVGTPWVKGGAAGGELELPIGIAIHEQTIFVTDHYINRVQTFDFDGKHLASLEVLPNPGGITADRDGTLYLSHFPVSRMSQEKHPDRVSVYSPT